MHASYVPEFCMLWLPESQFFAVDFTQLQFMMVAFIVSDSEVVFPTMLANFNAYSLVDHLKMVSDSKLNYC